jgi:hypothetical protein
MNSIIPAVYITFAMLFNLFLLVFNRLQHMQLFIYCERFYHIVEEKAQQEKRMNDKLNDEMRNLIASVSHDLKSVGFSMLISYLPFLYILS